LGADVVGCRFDLSCTGARSFPASWAASSAKSAFENGSVPQRKAICWVRLDASAEEALLRSAEAEAELARAGHWNELAALRRKKVLSKAELDAAQSKFNRLNAVADQMRF